MQNKCSMTAAISLMLLFLNGCSSEQNYRGVPASTWKRLSIEQKQLIVDRTYEDELNNHEQSK